MVFNEHGPPAKGGPSETILVNPQIVMRSRKADVDEEGCLSFPKIYSEVEVRVGAPRVCSCWLGHRWLELLAGVGCRGYLVASSVSEFIKPLPSPTPKLSTQRSEAIDVKYYDVDGQLQEKRLVGWVARIFQHEYDHLQVRREVLSPLRGAWSSRGAVPHWE
jgi:hypothetical protein